MVDRQIELDALRALLEHHDGPLARDCLRAVGKLSSPLKWGTADAASFPHTLRTKYELAMSKGHRVLGLEEFIDAVEAEYARGGEGSTIRAVRVQDGDQDSFTVMLDGDNQSVLSVLKVLPLPVETVSISALRPLLEDSDDDLSSACLASLDDIQGPIYVSRYVSRRDATALATTLEYKHITRGSTNYESRGIDHMLFTLRNMEDEAVAIAYVELPDHASFAIALSPSLGAVLAILSVTRRAASNPA